MSKRIEIQYSLLVMQSFSISFFTYDGDLTISYLANIRFFAIGSNAVGLT